jgi:ethanolamine utilization microcompartment shell protein EutL
MVMADTAIKSADIDLLMYASPNKVTSFTNEFMVMFTGDSGAVKQAVIAARDVGIKLLATMGDEPKPLGKPYLV